MGNQEAVDGRQTLLRDLHSGSIRPELNPLVDELSQALALEELGQYAEAVDQYGRAIQRAIAICRDHSLDAKHDLILFCNIKCANIFVNQGRYWDARNLAIRTVDATKKKFGLTSPATQSSVGTLARILRYLGQYKEAYELLVDVLDTSVDITSESLVTTNLLSLLAKVLKDMGLYHESRRRSRIVVRACHQLLEPSHPFTYNRESELAVVTSKLGSHATAERIARRALMGLSKTLGAAHPDTLRTCRRLANFLRFQGRIDEAKPMLETTLDYQQRIFTLGHPSTLSSFCSLAMIYALQKNISMAKNMFQRALQCQEGLFGSEHPQTRWTSRILFELKDIESEPASDEHIMTAATFDRVLSLAQSPSHPLEEDAESRNALYDSSGFERGVKLPREDEAFGLLQNSTDSHDHVIGKVLRSAAAGGRALLLEHLVKSGANYNSEGGYWGTALEAAALNGHYEIVNYLLQLPNVQLNARNGGALRAACFSGYEVIVKRLLNAGAQASIKHPMLGDSLDAALAGGHVRIVQLLREERNAEIDPAKEQDVLFGTPLQKAVVEGHDKVVDLLLQKGADPNSTQKGYFGSALELAAFTDREDVLRKLLMSRTGINIHVFLSAVQVAINAEHSGILSILLQSGTGKVNKIEKHRFVIASLATDGHSLEPELENCRGDLDQDTDTRQNYLLPVSSDHARRSSSQDSSKRKSPDSQSELTEQPSKKGKLVAEMTSGSGRTSSRSSKNGQSQRRLRNFTKVPKPQWLRNLGRNKC